MTKEEEKRFRRRVYRDMEKNQEIMVCLSEI
jgi:hypothetical protein